MPSFHLLLFIKYKKEISIWNCNVPCMHGKRFLVDNTLNKFQNNLEIIPDKFIEHWLRLDIRPGFDIRSDLRYPHSGPGDLNQDLNPSDSERRKPEGGRTRLQSIPAQNRLLLHCTILNSVLRTLMNRTSISQKTQIGFK